MTTDLEGKQNNLEGNKDEFRLICPYCGCQYTSHHHLCKRENTNYNLIHKDVQVRDCPTLTIPTTNKPTTTCQSKPVSTTTSTTQSNCLSKTNPLNQSGIVY